MLQELVWTTNNTPWNV